MGKSLQKTIYVSGNIWERLKKLQVAFKFIARNVTVCDSRQAKKRRHCFLYRQRAGPAQNKGGEKKKNTLKPEEMNPGTNE